MNDKPVAGILTTLAVMPMVVLCCLGPLVLGSAVLAGTVGWLAGGGGLATVGAALAVGALVLPLGIFAYRRGMASNGATARPKGLRRFPTDPAGLR
jgi:hypothetical protein